MSGNTQIMNQRWEQGRDSYRVPSETIRPSEYEVSRFAGDSEPKAFILEHHYSASYPAARFRFGLWRKGQLVGTGVFSHPPSDRVLTSVFPGKATDSVELGRFVLLDQVPGNGETWFLARCFAELRKIGLVGVLSHSDPIPRQDSSGRLIFPGHIGTIYQAHNGKYLGRSGPRTLRILPDGSVLHNRAIQKLRKRDRGWQHVRELLESHGAPAWEGEELRLWAARAVKAVTRPLRHPGNHKYAWPLSRRYRISLPALPYPKQSVA